MTAKATTSETPLAMRWALILSLALLAFLASYRFASAQSSTPTGTASPVATTGSSTSGAVSSGGTATPRVITGSTGCCGGGASANAPKVTKQAALKSGVQVISVDVSNGTYDPNTIQLKAGVPAEITFSQASGCTGSVQSSDLGFSEDLTTGPKTVKLAGLKPGTYSFYCGMQMVFGSVVVK
jgi:plastocyanin